VTLTGLHGTLIVDETGGYVYQPSASLGYSAVDLTDSFTYQLAQPNGIVASATLTVTIDVPADGVAPHATAMTAMQTLQVEADVIPLDALTVHAGVTLAAPDATAIGLATYDLFEGRGELEDVLSHYLVGQQHDAVLPTAETQVSTSVEVASTSPMVDSLDFLVTLQDQDHNGSNIHYAM
jgi:VCBS repeat-containing protein